VFYIKPNFDYAPIMMAMAMAIIDHPSSIMSHHVA
jgi:hypothetical protein